MSRLGIVHQMARGSSNSFNYQNKAKNTVNSSYAFSKDSPERRFAKKQVSMVSEMPKRTTYQKNIHTSQSSRERQGTLAQTGKSNQHFRIRNNPAPNMSNSVKNGNEEERNRRHLLKNQEDIALDKLNLEWLRDKMQREKEGQLQRERERQRQRERQIEREREEERQIERERQEERKRQREREEERQKQRQRQREREEEKDRQNERQKEKQRQRQRERERQEERDRQKQRLQQQSEEYMTKAKSPLYQLNPKTIGLVGLNNIGNTCFMNSTLQCVFNLPGFNDYFLEGRHEKQMKSNARVAQAYARMIKLMRSSSSRSETPSELKNSIGSKKSRFLGYAQQDAQQFLTALLELLSSNLNRTKNPRYKELSADTSKKSLQQISDEWWNYNKQREDSIVCDYFSGQILSRVVCSRCSNASIAFDNIWDVALNFGNQDHGRLLKMMQNFTKEENIANDYYCSKCKQLRSCKRKIDFYRLPKILVLQLKRFSYDHWRKTKLNNTVKIQQTLDLSSLITYHEHSSVDNPVYDLVGIVNHSGGIDFGHYTAECKNPINHKWYNFNDSHVSQTSLREEFGGSSPYLLFYAKQ